MVVHIACLLPGYNAVEKKKVCSLHGWGPGFNSERCGSRGEERRRKEGEKKEETNSYLLEGYIAH